MFFYYFGGSLFGTAISTKMRTVSSSSNNSDIPSGILPTPPPRPRSDSINSEQSRPDSRLYSPKSSRSLNQSKLPIPSGAK